MTYCEPRVLTSRGKAACAEFPSSSARKSPAWWLIVSTLARFRSGCSHPVPEPRSGSLAPSLGPSCVVSWSSACEVGARSVGPLTTFPRGAPPAAGGALGSGEADSEFGAAPGRQGKITTSSSSSRSDLKLARRTSRVISLHAAKHRW